MLETPVSVSGGFPHSGTIKSALAWMVQIPARGKVEITVGTQSASWNDGSPFGRSTASAVKFSLRSAAYR